MKKLLAVLLSAILCLTAVSAWAAEYANTTDFCHMLDDYGIQYTLSGVDSDGDELVLIDNSDSNGHEYTINVYFTEDNELIFMRVYYFISYDVTDYTAVALACNELNYNYKYVKIYADQSDNTVTADLDLIVRKGQSIGDIAMDGLSYLAQILEKSYQVLGQYDK